MNDERLWSATVFQECLSLKMQVIEDCRRPLAGASVRCLSGACPSLECACGEEALITLRSLHHPLLVGLSLALAFGAAGCATSDPETPPDLGTGGARSTGAAGTTGTAQSPAGGSTGTAGMAGPGGNTGTAGNRSGAGAAGVAGTVGGTAVGGVAGTVGAGRGGAAGAGGRASSGAAGSFSTTGAPTFTQVYNDIIVKYCAGSACHNPGRSGGASFKTKSSAYGVFSQFAVPGDVADSDIYAFITGDPPFMPPLDPTVPPDGAAELAAWISAGAQNN